MRRLHPVAVGILLALLFAATGAQAQFNYIFTPGSGTALPLNAPSVLFDGTPQAGSGQGGIVNQAIGGLDIGFTFTFDQVEYTQFTVSSNGVIGLGGSLGKDESNQLGGASSYPVIAPFWDALRISGGAGGCGSPMIRTEMIGSAPNRVRVIDFRDIELIRFLNGGGNSPWGTFQVRLYEGSNKIEFWYDRMSACDVCNIAGQCGATSASIGIAAGPEALLSVTPGQIEASAVPDDQVDLQTNGIEKGTLYTFAPCDLTVVGLTGPKNGGTAAMQNGDILLNGLIAQYGSSASFRPFVLRMGDAGCVGGYTLRISGDAAADYTFERSGTQELSGMLNLGQADSITIVVTPTAPGVRNATLDIVGASGFTRSYVLGARVPFVNYIGNLPQGGTATMLSGDTLFLGTKVPRFGSQSFTPFSLTNVGGESLPVSYTITGGGGQYTINPATQQIAGGASVTPTITFSPTGFGRQPATLTVTAGSETRVFTLLATSAAPGGELRFAGSKALIDSSTSLFNNLGGCVGDGSANIPVTVTNVGFEDFVISGVEFYETDTLYGQGQPNYPFRRDAQGRLVPMGDYLLTEQPVTGPVTPGTVHFPITVPQGATRTLYLTLYGSQPGKRFAKGFLRTNGKNFTGRDTNGVLTEGLLNLSMFGRASGATLATGLGRQLAKTIIFPATKVGESSMMRVRLANPGSCVLRVSMKELQVITGDVKEFTIVNRPTGSGIDPVTGDLLLAPGTIDSSMVVRFAPSHSGTRRATLTLRTNDSAIQIPGHTQRGVFYLDLVGSTPTMLAASNAEFGAALIGGGASEQQHQVVHLENTSGFPVEITSILIDGVDATEFAADGTDGFPTLPRTLMAGERLDLKLVFAPAAGGQSGERRAEVKLALKSGDTTVAELSAFAGTRVLDLTPSTLTFATITRGKIARRIVRVTNNGTIAMRINPPVIGGAGASDFSISAMPRFELQPGQSEEIEVTYSPAVAGPTSATMTITSNALLPGGLGVVTLNGTAVKAHGADGGDPSQTTMGGVGRTGDEQNSDPSDNVGTSGMESDVMTGGLSLRQSVPNPARDAVEISYRLAARGEVTLALYDANGRLVRVLDQGVREMGEQRVQVRVGDLASGVYHYRLTSGDRTVARTLTVVR